MMEVIRLLNHKIKFMRHSRKLIIIGNFLQSWSNYIMNKTENDIFSFSSIIKYVTIFLIVCNVIGTSLVLLASSFLKKQLINTNFKLHMTSMSFNDIGIGLLALPCWIIEVSFSFLFLLFSTYIFNWFQGYWNTWFLDY